MTKVVSEECGTPPSGGIDEAAGVKWLQDHLEERVAPRWSIPWILDREVTVKPLWVTMKGWRRATTPQARPALAHLPHQFHRQPAPEPRHGGPGG